MSVNISKKKNQKRLRMLRIVKRLDLAWDVVPNMHTHTQTFAYVSGAL